MFSLGLLIWWLVYLLVVWLLFVRLRFGGVFGLGGCGYCCVVGYIVVWLCLLFECLI